MSVLSAPDGATPPCQLEPVLQFPLLVGSHVNVPAASAGPTVPSPNVTPIAPVRPTTRTSRPRRRMARMYDPPRDERDRRGLGTQNRAAPAMGINIAPTMETDNSFFAPTSN